MTREELAIGIMESNEKYFRNHSQDSTKKRIVKTLLKKSTEELQQRYQIAINRA